MDTQVSENVHFVRYKSELSPGFIFKDWTDYIRIKNVKKEEDVPEYRLCDTVGCSYTIHRLPTMPLTTNKRKEFPEGSECIAKSKMIQFFLSIDFTSSTIPINLRLGYSKFYFFYHGHLILVTHPQGYRWFNKKMAFEAHWLNPDSPGINGKKLGPSTLLWKHQLDNSVLGFLYHKASTGSIWINESLIQTLAANPLILSKEALLEKNINAHQSLSNLDPEQLNVFFFILMKAYKNLYKKGLNFIILITTLFVFGVVLIVVVGTLRLTKGFS
ncbi:hypothetical protein HMI54_001644 [Coelomomyces lativittatus]|nr:hypothetical protein HMI56_004287 [Coelomomyces lativittatus]KAJ1510367.1 hypothetical protein HMI54_001644 [Coelomomyces lativittatus]